MTYFIIGFLLFILLDIVPRQRGTEPINWKYDGVFAVIFLWPLVVILLVYYYFEDGE